MQKKNHSIAYIKRQAKKLKKEQNITHLQALEQIAISLGYSNWKHCQRTYGQTKDDVDSTVPVLYQISFTDWLRKHSKRNSPLGDLSRDSIDDTTFPVCKSLKEYHSYLTDTHGASRGALDALKSAWETYTAYIRRKNSPPKNKPVSIKSKKVVGDERKIVYVKNIKPISYDKRTVEKFSPGDKAWISWDGSKAIPVTVAEVKNEHYSVTIERPKNRAGRRNVLFHDEVRSTPELACENKVTD